MDNNDLNRLTNDLMSAFLDKVPSSRSRSYLNNLTDLAKLDRLISPIFTDINRDR